jgi:hypothetical protein
MLIMLLSYVDCNIYVVYLHTKWLVARCCHCFFKKILQFWQILETDVAHVQLGSSKVVEYSSITDNYSYFDSVITYLIPKCNFLDRRSWNVVMCLC